MPVPKIVKEIPYLLKYEDGEEIEFDLAVPSQVKGLTNILVSIQRDKDNEIAILKMQTVRLSSELKTAKIQGIVVSLFLVLAPLAVYFLMLR